MKNCDKALSPVLLELTQKIQRHCPRDLDTETVRKWNDFPAEVLEQKLLEFLSQPPVDSSFLKSLGKFFIIISGEMLTVTEKGFAVGEKTGSARIVDTTPNFRHWFGGWKVEMTKSHLRSHEIVKEATNKDIIAALGGEKKVELQLSEIFSLMELQGEGQGGVLLVDGKSNTFFARNRHGQLKEIILTWHLAGWQRSAYDLYTAVPAKVGTRIFTRAA